MAFNRPRGYHEVVSKDTLASIVCHSTLNSYLAIADGESIGRVKFEMCEVSTHIVRSIRSAFENAD